MSKFDLDLRYENMAETQCGIGLWRMLFWFFVMCYGEAVCINVL